MKNLSLIAFLIASLILISCGDNKKETPQKPESEPVVQKAESSSLNWVTNVEEAVAKAKSEEKIVLVNFTGSDWCKWCIKLTDEVFSKPEFEAYAKENLVLVKLDFPRTIPQSEDTKNYNKAQAEKFKIRGYPTIILLNGEGEIVGNTGYQPGGSTNYVEHIKSFI